MKLVAYVIPLLFALEANGALFKNPPTHIKGEAGLTALMVDDQQTEARVVSFSMFANIKQDVLKTLEAHVVAGGVLEAGSNESIYVDEFKPRQDLVLKEASLNYNPIQQLALSAGAINQGKYNSPLLLTDTAFVAAEESLNFTYGDYSFGIFLSQSVPSNQFLTNRLNSVDEGAPSLLMEGVQVHLAGDVMYFKAQGMRFKFNNLSSNVANTSAQLGNETIGSSPVSTFFRYEFAGYNFNFDIGFSLVNDISINFRGQYLYNEKAPENKNTGTLAVAEFSFGNFSLNIDYFQNDSNSSPAFYNSPLYGHNDRTGLGGGLSWFFPKEATKIYLRGYNLKTDTEIYLSDSVRIFAGIKRSFNFD